MFEEKWKEVIGYSGVYSISNHGRVFNNKRNKMLKNYRMPVGYEVVNLHQNRVSEKNYIHRLVGIHFIENPNNYPMINHKDEVKHNNLVSNLEWCTANYNLNHGTRNERIRNHPTFKTQSKERSQKVKGTPVNGGKVIYLHSMTEGVKYGFNKQEISKCCLGKHKTHRGYTWEKILS